MFFIIIKKSLFHYFFLKLTPLASHKAVNLKIRFSRNLTLSAAMKLRNACCNIVQSLYESMINVPVQCVSYNSLASLVFAKGFNACKVFIG